MNHLTGGNHVFWGIIRSTINLFKNAISCDLDTIKVESGKAIREVINLNFPNCLIFANGYRVDENYILKEKDLVTIREFPSAVLGAGSVIAGIAGVVMGVATLATFGAVGFGIAKHIDKLKVDNESTKGRTDIPSISGGKNQSALGKPIPLILGKTLFAPYYINEPYVTEEGTDGKDQYYTGLYLLGYNNITVKDIYLGKNRLVASNKNNVENGQIEIDGFYNDSYGIQLELKQNAEEVNLLSQKVVQDKTIATDLHCTKDEEDVVKRVPVYAFSAKYPQKVAVSIQMPSLVKYNDEGGKVDATVKVGLQMSLDGGNSWLPFGAGFTGANDTVREDVDGIATTVSTFTRSKDETIRFTATREFTYNEIKDCANHTVQVKVLRVTEEPTDSSTQNTVSLTRITTWCYDPQESEKLNNFVPQTPMLPKWTSKTARLGFKIKAGSDVDGQIDELNCILTSKARTWNGYEWSTTLSETSNPASLALLALTGDYRGNYKYSDDKLDLDSFGEFYEWCDQDFNFGKDENNNDIILKRFSCDGVVVNSQKTSDLLANILATGRGNITVFGSKYGINIDKPKDTPVMVLNNQNVLSRSNTKNFNDIIDGYNIEYIDAIQKYIQNSFIAVPNGTDKDSPTLKLEKKSYLFTTNPRRAYCRAMYELACQKLRPETWTAKVSVDGNLVEVGSLVEIQDDTISVGIGDGAEVKRVITENGYITGIETDGEFNVDTNNTYGCKITIANGNFTPKVITKELTFTRSGRYSELTFTTPILATENYVPTIGDIVSFGIYDKVTALALVMGKKSNGNDTFDLTLVPYQEGIYSADLGTIPAFNANITTPNEAGTEINDGSASITDLYNALGKNNTLVMSKIARLYSNHIVTLYRELKEGESAMTVTGITSSLTYSFANNTLEWSDISGSNDWLFEKPTNATRPVFVTSATAFGKGETDVIESNEWASPVEMGLNGVNGLSIADIKFYKRSLTEPVKPTYGGTYNFNTGDFTWDSLSYNEWTRNIPPLDEQSSPIWETHVVALSNEASSSGSSLVDHIEANEWSTPIQYSANSYMTKEEIEKIVDERVSDASTPYIYVEPSNVIGFNVNNSGYIPINQSIELIVHVLQYNEELTFEWGDLSTVIPSDFTWITEGNKVKITAIAGGRLGNIQSWELPLIFREFKENYEYHKLNGTDDIRESDYYSNIYYELLSSKPADWDTAYGSYYVEIDGFIQLNTSSTWSANKFYRQLVETAYGYVEYAEDYTERTASVSMQPVVGGTYQEPVKSISELQYLMSSKKLIIGDFIVWLGENTASELSQEGQFKKNCAYCYVGDSETYKWQLDTDRTHIADTLSDIVSNSMTELDIAENTGASNYFKKLFASELVVRTLIAQDAFIENLFSKEITLETGGSIMSAEYGTRGTGFLLKSDGTAILTNATVTGSINAESLKILEGSTYKDVSTYVNDKITSAGSITTDTIKNNIVATQMIYKQLVEGSAQPSVPQTYITSTTDGWVLSKPSYKQDYLVWSCTQYKTFEGTVGSTTPTLLGDTIIDTATGYIRTNLIEVDTLLSKDITIKYGGMIHTENYKSGDSTGFRLNANEGIIETNYIIANNGSFKGSVTADYAKFNNGLIKNYIYYNDVAFTNLHSYLKSYSVKGIYEANGYLRFRSSQSWFSGIVRDFEILNVVCGNGFNVINGYKSSIRISNTIALIGSTRDGYLLTGDVSLVDDGYLKFSVIDVNGTWYYYDGHNTNVNSYDKTGSITGSIKLDVCISY